MWCFQKEFLASSKYEQKNTRRSQLKCYFSWLPRAPHRDMSSTIWFDSEKTHKQKELMRQSIIFLPVTPFFYYKL